MSCEEEGIYSHGPSKIDDSKFRLIKLSRTQVCKDNLLSSNKQSMGHKLKYRNPHLILKNGLGLTK